MDGLYFDGSPEPNSFYYDLIMREKEKAKKKGYKFVTIDAKDADDFYDTLLSMQKYAEDNVQIYSTTKEGNYEIFLNEEVDIDDKNGPSIEADAKKKSKKEKEEIMKKRQKIEEEEDIEE